MLSVLRVATPVTTFKLSPPPHHGSPYSPFCKRATLTVVITDATSLPAASSDYPLLTTSLPRVARTQRLPLLTRPLTIGDISGNTADNGTANPFACATTHRTSSFPVQGPFDLLYCIQNGGFGSAWAAKDQSTGRLLCLKVFQSLNDPDVTRSVKMELRMFRRMVKSQGGERGKQFIIELSRSIQHGTTVFFAMELMTTDLAMYLATDPDRCKMHARQWIAQMALGIEALHDMGIIHRDIKSENILIDSRENVRIVDFGLSYLNPAGKSLSQGVEYAIDFLGTPQYMAPEVLRNKDMPLRRRRRYGVAVDWWALGCILFELESENHQVLFDAERDVHIYVAWTQRVDQLEDKYSSFRGLDPLVVDLLEGLLRPQPFARFSLNNLEKHEYFLHRDGTSEFHNTAARALERPVRPELEPQFTDNDRPIMIIEAAKPSSIFDWSNVKCAYQVDE